MTGAGVAPEPTTPPLAGSTAPVRTAVADLRALRRMGARARTLRERLEGRRATDVPCMPSSTAEAYMRRWSAVVTAGDEPAFARRLGWDGLSPGVAAAAVEQDEVDVLPPWCETFAAAYGATERELVRAFERLGLGVDRARVPDDPLPFEALFTPLLEYARSRVSARCSDDVYAGCTPDAHAALERALLRRLTWSCARVFGVEFSSYCAARRHLWPDCALSGGNPDDEGAFVADMSRGRLFRVFEQYPVAARLCSRLTELWVDATQEFLDRLACDTAVLAETLRPDRTPLGPVVHVETGLSDAHGGGRSVLIVRWASGLRAVYKPRSLGIDAAFGRLVEWAEARGSCAGLRPLRVLTRPGYGWIEYASPASCASLAGVNEYYERCGALLAIAYATNGADFHYENLLAAGEQPVLLDLEMLLGPRFELVEKLPTLGAAGTSARQYFAESVLNTLILPTVRPGRSGTASPRGGLDDVAASAPPGVLPRATHNLPVFDGRQIPAQGYTDAVVRGFTEMYRTLTDGRAELLAATGPFDRIRHEPIRFILRDTSVYGALLERVLHPAFLRDGADWGAQLDVLARTFLSLDERPGVWAALEQETRALEDLDVPFFDTSVSDRDLRLTNGARVTDCFVESAFEMLERRLSRMGDSDLEVQTCLLRASFAAVTRRDLRAPASRPAADTEPGDRSCPFDRTAALHTVAHIAAALRQSAVSWSSHDASWLALSYLPAARRSVVQPMPFDLFDGYLGLALFLAAFDRVTGDAGYRHAIVGATRALSSRRDEVERIVRMRRGASVGLGFGITAAAYAVAHTGRLLGDDDLTAQAYSLCNLVTPRLVEADDACDVVSGSAGAILVLLALDGMRATPEFVERACEFGAHLLRKRVVDQTTGARVWPGQLGRIDTGAAHGQAGIAAALRRLAAVTGDQQYRAAADEGIAFERRAMGDHLAGAACEEEAAAWARGATGIGLARLQGLGAWNEPDARAEVMRYADITRRALGTGNDTLASGDAGRIEFLHEVGRRLGSAESSEGAYAAAAALIGRAASAGTIDTGWAMHSCVELGLFRGAAGVGYTLLRLCEPTVVPSVLLAD